MRFISLLICFLTATACIVAGYAGFVPARSAVAHEAAALPDTAADTVPPADTTLLPVLPADTARIAPRDTVADSLARRHTLVSDSVPTDTARADTVKTRKPACL